LTCHCGFSSALKLHALRKGVCAAFLSAFDLVCVYVRSAAAAANNDTAI